MTQYVNDIEHPVQNWWPHGYKDDLEVLHTVALKERYQTDELNIKFIIDALYTATASSHARRGDHEDKNLRKMGLYLPARRQWYAEDTYTETLQEYEQLAGRKELVGKFIILFSRLAHSAFLAQDAEQPNKPFDHISLELGGKRQFSDWEATGSLDDMIRNVPEQLIDAHHEAHIIVYGEPKEERFEHARVDYLPDAPKSYVVFPRLEPGTNVIRTAMLRRRRPIADIYVPNESDIVLFKESNFLLILDYTEPELRKQIEDDIESALETERQKEADGKETGGIRLQDCESSDSVGKLAETAIAAPKGINKDIVPVSAHYIQGVGAKYARFREKT